MNFSEEEKIKTPADLSLPKITVVTPSYNQGEYLEETIDSVLSQNYPKLEYIIIDGGSTDASVEIIKKYEKHLAYWQSKPDKGQAEAIGVGFSRASGKILAWLNSDDMYEPGTLLEVGKQFACQSNLQLLYGDYTLVYPDGTRMFRRKISYDFNICLYIYMMVAQPSAFWTKSIYKKVGGIDPQWQYVMDYDLFLRIGEACKGSHGAIRHIRSSLSLFRVHDASKSVLDGASCFKAEQKRLKARWINESRVVYKFKQKIYKFKTAYKFLTERGMVPLRKPPGKY